MRHLIPILFASMLTLAAIAPAFAHEWYPMECCSGMDCAPVEKTERVPIPNDPTALPMLLVTTKHGTVMIPRNFPFRESKDNRMHVCMRPTGVPADPMRLLCVFVPPTN